MGTKGVVEVDPSMAAGERLPLVLDSEQIRAIQLLVIATMAAIIETVLTLRLIAARPPSGVGVLTPVIYNVMAYVWCRL